MMEEKFDYDEYRLQSMIHFLKSQGERGTAQYVVNLQSSLENLLNNLTAYEKEFKRLYPAILTSKRLIELGIEIMTPEQVEQWEGVKAWVPPCVSE